MSKYSAKNFILIQPYNIVAKYRSYEEASLKTGLSEDDIQSYVYNKYVSKSGIFIEVNKEILHITLTKQVHLASNHAWFFGIQDALNKLPLTKEQIIESVEQFKPTEFGIFIEVDNGFYEQRTRILRIDTELFSCKFPRSPEGVKEYKRESSEKTRKSVIKMSSSDFADVYSSYDEIELEIGLSENQIQAYMETGLFDEEFGYFKQIKDIDGFKIARIPVDICNSCEVYPSIAQAAICANVDKQNVKASVLIGSPAFERGKEHTKENMLYFAYIRANKTHKKQPILEVDKYGRIIAKYESVYIAVRISGLTNIPSVLSSNNCAKSCGKRYWVKCE